MIEADFGTLTEPFRGELIAHCYRLLGSRFDAEDAVQDTYVRAWRGYERFEGRSSLRRWLYTIATRVCLTALENRRRRPLPSGLGPPSGDHASGRTAADPGETWLEPLPDQLLRAGGDDPASVVAARAGVRLAFVAALQHLPARQRAALVLCDVLGWPAATVAEMLESTPAGVNSALQRARAQLRTAGVSVDEVAEPSDAQLRVVLDRYTAAFEQADVGPLVGLLRADIELEMPPTPTWFRGKEAVLGFLSARVLCAPWAWELRPVRSNGQPGFETYERTPDGVRQPHGLQVLTVVGDQVTRISAFNDPRLLTGR